MAYKETFGTGRGATGTKALEEISRRVKSLYKSLPVGMSYWIPLSIITVTSAVVLFSNLVGGSLLVWDEATYAEVAKEMLRSGDWLTLHRQGLPFFDKPPLMIWILALTYSALGVSEYTTRIWPAAFGVATILVLVHFGSRMYDRRTALLGGAILLWSAYAVPIYTSFVFMSRVFMLDIPLTFFSVTSLWAFWKSLNRPRFILLASIAAGLGFMTKGAAMLPTLAVIFLFLIGTRRLSFVRTRLFLAAVALFLLIVLPWHLFQIFMYGQNFVEAYLGYHVIERALVPLDYHVGPYSFYFDWIRYIFGFWMAASAVGLLIVAREYARKRKDQNLLTLLWVGIPILAFTIAQTKLPWYIVPNFPVVALLAGRTLSDFTRRPAGLAGVGGIATVVAFISSQMPFQRAGTAALLLGFGMALLAYLAGRVWNMGVHRSTQPSDHKSTSSVGRALQRRSQTIATLVILLIVLSGLHVFPPPDQSHNIKEIVLFANGVIPSGSPLVSFHDVSYQYLPAVVFYSDHAVVALAGAPTDQSRSLDLLQNRSLYAVSTKLPLIERANCTVLHRSGSIMLFECTVSNAGAYPNQSTSRKASGSNTSRLSTWTAQLANRTANSEKIGSRFEPLKRFSDIVPGHEASL